MQRERQQYQQRHQQRDRNTNDRDRDRHTNQYKQAAPEPQPVEWSAVVDWIRANPHGSTPPPVSMESTIECISIPVESASVWTQMHVEPSTPLSCLLGALDAEGYNVSTESGRRAILRETCTGLQVRAEKELKGRAYPKTKMDAGLVEVTEKEHSPWCPYGLAGLAALYKIQMVILNETDKKLTFVPEDVAAWTKEIPVYYFAHNFRSIYVPPRGFGAHMLLNWLVEKEGAGWTWEFKEVKGTIAEIRQFCEDRGVDLTDLPAKAKKEALVEKASRGAVYKLLGQWVSAA